MLEIWDKDHLESLPDGTIIEWQRIVGDETSTAVAYVRSEVEGAETHAIACKFNECLCERVVWISPGGWQPLTPEQAGINYPARVVRIGPGNDDRVVTPSTPHAQPPVSVRMAALDAASRVRAGDAINSRVSADLVTELADKFVTWLQGGAKA
ncbi:hypothetical protein HL05_gp061 [Mycobacterium phage Manad]|uniref:Uncharacterized protein n=1 Tax=Mycobacterium phage Manad TaxID=1486403 RepID=A0A059VAN9_9CAUD|nr:hypothetical protein HL05_gp061 [Mycobacterium phage Manad]AHZ95321.1 hypothetical protein PBI_MANAD_61 [Mycobacterium phage Manad]